MTPPDARLSVADHPPGIVERSFEPPPPIPSRRPPNGRLALAGAQGERNGCSGFEVGDPPAPGGTFRENALPTPEDRRPALLVSFVYLKSFLKQRHRYAYRDWVLDSGAFSAYNSGRTITVESYIERCRELIADDPTLTEVYSLDVIGDWKASLKNTEAMWDAGIPAIPCYHVNEPEHVLLTMAREYPKIALGGVALARSRKEKLRWAEQCFSRIWPHKIHGFAYCNEEAMLRLPFHSTDSTTWELGPCGYGTWKAFGRMSVRGSSLNLRAEVEFFLDLEARARDRWKKEMKEIASPAQPDLRLATAGHTKPGHFLRTGDPGGIEVRP